MSRQKLRDAVKKRQKKRKEKKNKLLQYDGGKTNKKKKKKLNPIKSASTLIIYKKIVRLNEGMKEIQHAKAQAVDYITYIKVFIYVCIFIPVCIFS